MSSSSQQWVLPAGTTSRDGWDTWVDDSTASWHHTGLWTATLLEGEQLGIDSGRWEYVVLPLAGAARVRATSAAGSTSSAFLTGRPSVFAGPTDVAYVPGGSSLIVTGASPLARVAICAARVTDASRSAGRTFRHLAAAEVPTEMRGAGSASREVRNFAVPAVLEAEAIIACEVVTPAGNWSSYPPHKHDEERPGRETELEEIYYFETQVEGAAAGGPVPANADPIGYQRVYGTQKRPIDVLAEVRTGDVVLVPHGWHGPAMAVPGYDLYYLNVMAGPGPTRDWLICDDPSHGWVRETWAGRSVDPRLPMGGAR